MNVQRSGLGELAPLLLLMLAAALAWLAPASLGAQLEARTRSDAALYAQGGTPFEWDFSLPRARVGPLQGLLETPATSHGLSLALRENRGDFGLRLSGRRIDPAALPTLTLNYTSDSPLRLRLRAAHDLAPHSAPGPWMEIPARTTDPEPPQGSIAALRIDLSTMLPLLEGPLAQLRLEFEGEPGQRWTLLSAQALPARCGDQPCLPKRVELPEDRSTRWLLAVRDEYLEVSPQLRVGATAPAPLVWLASTVTDMTLAFAGGLAMVLALLAIAARRLQPGPAHSTNALLIAVFVPALLLAAGLPRFPSQMGDAVLLLGWVVALWWLRPATAGTGPVGGHVPQFEATPTVVDEPPRSEAGTAEARLDMSNPVHAHRHGSSSRAAWGAAALFTAVAAAALLGWAWLDGMHVGMNPRATDAERALRYLGWAALQQLWLAYFILPHLRHLGFGGWGLPMAGLLFAALHLPNLELMGLTFIGGCVWAWMADRYGRLMPQIASHVVLGLVTAALLPPGLLRSLEVGGRYVFAPL